MQTNLIVTVPDEAEILDIARQITDNRMHLITNGERSCLSPIVPPGWTIQLSCNSHKARQLAQVAA